MCFDLQLMKHFYYSNYSLILWLDLHWNGVITYICPIGLHLRSQGRFILAGWKVCQWFFFLFKAAIGTLVECLMFCLQRKETCYKLGRMHIQSWICRCRWIYMCICAHTMYMYMHMYVYVYAYILQAINLFKIIAFNSQDKNSPLVIVSLFPSLSEYR